MRLPVPTLTRSCLYLSLAAALVLVVLAGGCTQQAAGTQDTSSGVKVTKTDDAHITVAWVGAPGLDNVTELEITLTDSNGKSLTKSIGSRLGTTPVQLRATYSFTGSYAGKNHVTVTGYLSDGTHRMLVDRDI